jgi:MFS family permease
VSDILRLRSAWFSFFGHFCGNYFYYFLLTWLPAYLQKERQFPAPKMAVMGAVAFLAAAASSVLSGWLSDRWVALGGSPTRVRKTFCAGGLLLSTVILPMAVIRDNAVAMPLLIAACAFIGMWSSNLWAITQTLAGPRAAGKWTAVQNGVGNIAGVAAPWFTGWVVGRTGQFYMAFLVAALVALAGSAIYVFGVGPVKQARFRSETLRNGA